MSGIALALFLVSAPPAASFEVGDMELTSPVRQNFKRLQEAWQEWIKAYLQNDPEKATTALQQLKAIAGYLGADKLPDLAITCAAFAAQSAEEGNFERAGWALDAARELDPERPEIDFARAVIERHQGHYLGAFSSIVKGHGKLAELPTEGVIWKQDLSLGAIYLVLLAGGLFLFLLVGAHGSDLYYDLGRLISPPLPPAAADAVAAALLIWPIFLPSGLLWLMLYWSILIWGYGRVSQRGVLIGLWVALGFMPLAVAQQQREVQDALLPPVRAIENLKTGRLYGSLFLDLEVMRSVLPDSTVVTELVADLHRNFGQWEHARLLYSGLIEGREDDTLSAAARNNLGVYHHRKGDYGTAVNYFVEATQVDPTLPEVYFNLSQAYSQNFEFTEAHQALAQAKQLNSVLVEAWERSEGGEEGNVVPIDGGLRRASEILTAIDEAGRDSLTSGRAVWRRYVSLGASVAAILLALTLHLARRQKGYPSQNFTGKASFVRNRWLGALVPGWASTVDGNGIQALLAVLLPVALALVPLVRQWGYRVPVGYDSGSALLGGLALAGVGLYFLVRLVLALRR